ncbi:MAG: hypothetical protein AB4426_27810 [Xenococcaceae cyanobacterium]
MPLRGRQKAKGLHAKVLIGKALMILSLAGYFHRAALACIIHESIAKKPKNIIRYHLQRF